MAYVELTIAEEVAATTEECVSHTPVNGKKIRIKTFTGEAAYSKNSAVKLIWDIDGAGEEILWSIKGGGKMPESLTFQRTGDGVKKLAVCLDNGETGNVFMSGHLTAMEED